MQIIQKLCKTSFIVCLLLYVVPTVPTQFRANSDTPTSIILTWGPPSMPNGPIINYYIRYNATSHVEIPDSGNLQVPGNMEQWTVSGLEEHVLYEFYISAATSAGVGDEVFIFETTLEFSKYLLQ